MSLLLKLHHAETAVVVIVAAATATPNWGWSCTSTFACRSRCCRLSRFVPFLSALLQLLPIAAAAVCLFVAAVAASLALISGFGASGCRGLQVYVHVCQYVHVCRVSVCAFVF